MSKWSLQRLVGSWQHRFTKRLVRIASHCEKGIRIANYVGGTDKARQIDKLQVAQPPLKRRAKTT